MSENTVAESVTRLATPLAESLALTIWGLEIAFGGKSMIRLYVEGEKGVDIDRCAELSRMLSLSLDVEDILPGAYVLEISSPGLERTFFRPEQLEGHIGDVLDVSLHAPTKAFHGRKKIIGTLLSLAEGTICLAPLDGGDDVPFVRFAWEDAKKIKLVHFLPETNAIKGKTVGRPKTQKNAALKTNIPGKAKAAGIRTAANERDEEDGA